MTKAFVFPGQGSQKVGMGKDFYDNFQEAKNVFEEVNEALGKNLTKIIFEGPQEVLTQTENAQPALMCVSMAILKVIEKEAGKKVADLCNFVAGHSLGEYSALCASEVLTIADTAKLLKVRGQAFAEVGKEQGGTMAALIGVTIEQAEEIADKTKQASGKVCQVANDNTVGQVVISGHEEAIDKAVEIATEMQIKRAIKLPVSGAFHSELMTPAVEKMREALESVTISEPQIPVIANVSANQVFLPEEIKDSLLKQITGRVRWRETMLNLESMNIKQIWEIGSGAVLSRMVPRTCPNIQSSSVNSLEGLKEMVGGL